MNNQPYKALGAGVLLLAALGGCVTTPRAADGDRSLPPPVAPATGEARMIFGEPSSGLRLTYPPEWEVHPDDNFVLRIAPPGIDPRVGHLSIDVPKLPPHIPGLIPIGLVRNGYVNDLKSAHPDVAIEDVQTLPVGGAAARQVRATWTENGVVRHERALLMVRRDHVVILRGVSDAETRAVVDDAFDSVRQTIGWALK